MRDGWYWDDAWLAPWLMIMVSWCDTVGETWSQETIMAGKKIIIMTASVTSLSVPNDMRQSDMESHSDRASVLHCSYEQCATSFKKKKKKQQALWSLRPFRFLTVWYLTLCIHDVLDIFEIKLEKIFKKWYNCTCFACKCFSCLSSMYWDSYS